MLTVDIHKELAHSSQGTYCNQLAADPAFISTVRANLPGEDQLILVHAKLGELFPEPGGNYPGQLKTGLKAKLSPLTEARSSGFGR
jgi:hypothetical protein